MIDCFQEKHEQIAYYKHYYNCTLLCINDLMIEILLNDMIYIIQ